MSHYQAMHEKHITYNRNHTCSQLLCVLYMDIDILLFKHFYFTDMFINSPHDFFGRNAPTGMYVMDKRKTFVSIVSPQTFMKHDNDRKCKIISKVCQTCVLYLACIDSGAPCMGSVAWGG